MGVGGCLLVMLGAAVLEGQMSALSTFISQTYGAKNYELCAIHLNRARVVVTIIFVPFSIVSTLYSE